MSKLRFFYGEMGSGKTAKLIDDIVLCEEENPGKNNVAVMKPAIDTKNGDKLLSRNGRERKVDCLITKDCNLFELIKTSYSDVKSIFIDEAQFLSTKQINQLLKAATTLNVDINAYGLRLNFHTDDENFAGATRLLQVSHENICIKSKCDICHEEQAVFSCLFENGRIVSDPPTILISDGEKKVDAHAVCAKCYYDLC